MNLHTNEKAPFVTLLLSFPKLAKRFGNALAKPESLFPVQGHGSQITPGQERSFKTNVAFPKRFANFGNERMIVENNPDDARRDLIEVLRDARELLARPDNDFAWSSWENAPDALAEIDNLIAFVAAGYLPHRLSISVLFAPTGPIQEVSLSSGWGQPFLAVAERYDWIERRLWPADAQ